MAGLFAAGESTGDTRYWDYIAEYTRFHQAHHAEVSWSDHATPALAALRLLQQSSAYSDLEPMVQRVVSYIMTAPRTPTNKLLRHLGEREDRWELQVGKAFLPRAFPDVWVDTLFHISPTLRRYSLWTGNQDHVREAWFQVAGFFEHLQDPSTGLLAHGYFDAPRSEVVPPFSNDEFWARGNGWALVSAVDLLQAPPSNANGDPLRQRTLRLEAALRTHQDPSSGLFHTLLRKPNTYLETAGSALILYGMAHGVRTELFGQDTQAAVERGAMGLDRVLRQRGSWTQVSGTSTGTNPIAGLYRFIPRRNQVTYGVGAFLLAASEIAGPWTARDLPTCEAGSTSFAPAPAPVPEH
jgi:rhamnogalacturonyl hydrolase YesR